MSKLIAGLLMIFLLNSSTYAEKTLEDYILSAQSLIDAGDYEAAIIPIYRAFEIDSTSVRAYFERARVYEGMAVYDAAYHDYEIACNSGEIDAACTKLSEITELLDNYGNDESPTAIDRHICFLPIYSVDYKKVQQAHQQLQNGKTFFPDIASRQSDLGPFTEVTCLNYGEIEPALVFTLDTLTVSKVSEIVAGLHGYFIFLKLYDGPERNLGSYPWEPVLAALRDSAGVVVTEPDSTGAEGVADARESRRSRRHQDEDQTEETEGADAPPSDDSRRSRRHRSTESVDVIAPEAGADEDKPILPELADIYDEPKFIPYDVAPKPIKKIPPEYPAEGNGLYGDVLLQVLVDKDGAVINAKVHASFDPGDHGFDEAALAAIGQWTFEPAVWHDQPIAVWVVQKVSFLAPQ